MLSPSQLVVVHEKKPTERQLARCDTRSRL